MLNCMHAGMHVIKHVHAHVVNHAGVILGQLVPCKGSEPPLHLRVVALPISMCQHGIGLDAAQLRFVFCCDSADLFGGLVGSSGCVF